MGLLRIWVSGREGTKVNVADKNIIKGKRGSLMTSGLGESARKKRMSGTSTAGLSKVN